MIKKILNTSCSAPGSGFIAAPFHNKHTLVNFRFFPFKDLWETNLQRKRTVNVKCHQETVQHNQCWFSICWMCKHLVCDNLVSLGGNVVLTVCCTAPKWTGIILLHFPMLPQVPQDDWGGYPGDGKEDEIPCRRMRSSSYVKAMGDEESGDSDTSPKASPQKSVRPNALVKAIIRPRDLLDSQRYSTCCFNTVQSVWLRLCFSFVSLSQNVCPLVLSP